MVTKEKPMFKKGDWIVHYFHGVGKVNGIVEKGLDGNEKTFYKVTTKDINYWIPFDDADCGHIEPIRSKKDFKKALKVLSTEPQPIAKHHKTRKKRIHERWRDGDLNSRAELLRDLYGRLKLEKLNFNEREMMEKVKRHFIDEWLIADESLNRKNAKKQIRAALKEGVKIAKQNRRSEE